MILQEWMQLFVKNKDVGETKIVKYFTQSSLIIIPRTTTDAHNKTVTTEKVHRRSFKGALSGLR